MISKRSMANVGFLFEVGLYSGTEISLMPLAATTLDTSMAALLLAGHKVRAFCIRAFQTLNQANGPLPVSRF